MPAGHPHRAGPPDRVPGGQRGGRLWSRATRPARISHWAEAPCSWRRSTWCGFTGAAHGVGGAGGAGRRLSGRSSATAGHHRNQCHPSGGGTVDQLPAPERDRRGRYRTPVHPPGPESGSHPGARERLATAPDRRGQQLHLRNGRGVERSGSERAARERNRPDRSAAGRCLRPVRVRCHRRRCQPGPQGGRVHPLRERRRRPLRTERLLG